MKKKTPPQLIDAQKAYDALVSSGMITSDRFIKDCVECKIGSVEAACKPALIEKQIPVKDHRMFIAVLLGDNIEAKEKQPSVKEVRK